jgi:hypothetical protein
MELRTITIVSGGQTGADRAALEFAIAHGIAYGGWCPRGRLAEDGPIPPCFQLEETPSAAYAQRTEWNVRDADATVLFSIAPAVKGGTSLTVAIAQRLGRPWLHLHRDLPLAAQRLREFLLEHAVERLNVAGPRASQEPQVGSFVQAVLAAALEA